MKISADHPLFTYAKPRFVIEMLTLFTVQAVLNALGTLALALAGRHLGEPTVFTSYIGAFLFLSVAPNAVVVLIRRTEMRGYLATYFRFLTERLDRHAGRPALWSSRGRRELFLTAIGPEAEQYLAALAYSTFDLYAFGLNIVLNGLVLALAIDADFAWAAVGSVTVSALVYWSQRRAISGLVEREQSARLTLGAYVMKAWDNVLLKNAPVHANYRRTLEDHYDEAHVLAGRSAFRAELTVFLLNLASAVPPFAVIGWMLAHHAHDVGLMGALVVTIPRQIENLRTFRYFYQQVTNARIFRTRFDSAVRNSQLDGVALARLVQIERLTINDQTFTSVDEVTKWLSTRRAGRFVVRGANGTGKSSLLLDLHQRLPSSLYLPPVADLELGAAAVDESTGQRLLRQLAFVGAALEPVLMLDEWDANLDAGRRAEIEILLNQMATKRVIIEVRHHA